MAYPVIAYNSSTGSNTAPSDSDANSADSGATASGTASGTTITFSTSVDCSACADDDSDYIWCETTSGGRHLFRITAFTGGLSTCTAVTVEPAIEADFSGADWHINGTRQSLQSDTSNTDINDWIAGWTAELDGTFVMSAYASTTFGRNISGTTSTDPAIKVVRSPSASSRPVIDIQANVFMTEIQNYAVVYIEGIKVTSTTGGGSSTYVRINAGGATFVDCVLDVGNATPTQLVYSQYTNRRISLINCYLKGGTNHVLYGIDMTAPIHVSNCWLDCQGTYGSVAGLFVGASSMSLTDTLITEATGDGIKLDPMPSWAGSDQIMIIKNVTVADCSGDAIDLSEAQNADTTPLAIFSIYNCLCAGNGGYGINTDTAGSGIPDRGYVDFNAFYNNTSGNYSEATLSGANDITLTADPFTDAASDDYSLNNTTGGGASVRDAALYDMPDGT